MATLFGVIHTYTAGPVSRVLTGTFAIILCLYEHGAHTLLRALVNPQRCYAVGGSASGVAALERRG